MKPLLSCVALMLLPAALCGCFNYSAEYTTRVTVNSDPQGAQFCQDEDGEPGRVVATTPFAMNLRIKVYGSGWECDQHSKVWGSAGVVAAVFDEQYFFKGTIYQLGLRGILKREGYEQVRLCHLYYNEHVDRYSTRPWQEIARFSDRKRPPGHITVTIPLTAVADTSSGAVEDVTPKTLVISTDPADCIPARPGMLVVDSDVRGALVFVDDKLQGAAPCTLSLMDGFYAVQVKSDAGGEYRTTVRVLPDSEAAVHAVLGDQAE
jgi:hypothetical protein